MSVSMMIVLALSAGQPKVNPSEATGPKYSIDASETTHEVAVGKTGRFVLNITPAKGYVIKRKGPPLKVKLASEGVSLKKTMLKNGDMAGKKGDAPRFDVPFTGQKAGATDIQVDAMFYVCDDKICEKKKAQLTVPVSVRP